MSNVNLHLGCTFLKAANDSGPRKQPPKYIVIHSTESPNERHSARNVAQFFHRPETQASVQIVVDDYECYRCLGDDLIPWGAPPFNSRGLHIEQCGYAKWTRPEWLRHRATIDRAARAAAYWAKAYRIPVKFLSVTNCKRYEPGITTHHNVSLAFGKSDHTDPGSGYPIDYFMGKVKAIYDGIS